jgi:hypothetical protein
MSRRDDGPVEFDVSIGCVPVVGRRRARRRRVGGDAPARRDADRGRGGRGPGPRVPTDARDVRDGGHGHHDDLRRPGARHDGQRVHVGLAPAAPRPDLGRRSREDARVAERGQADRDQRALREPGGALRSLRGAAWWHRGRAELRRRPRDAARRGRPRASGREGHALVLGRRPLAVPRARGVRPLRAGEPAPVPRRALRGALGARGIDPGRTPACLAREAALGRRGSTCSSPGRR